MYMSQGQTPPPSGASFEDHCKYWTEKSKAYPTDYNKSQQAYYCKLAGKSSGGSSGGGISDTLKKGLDIFGSLFGGSKTPTPTAPVVVSSGPPQWVYLAGIALGGLVLWKVMKKKR